MLLFDSISRVSDEEMLKARAMRIDQLLKKIFWYKILMVVFSFAVVTLIFLIIYILNNPHYL
jgi:hypothetical protein